MSMTYRPDIDGLRALAVFPVILFHAGHPWFTGGFLGVDVFFVISGFLITSFIVSGLQNNKFSFFDFYDRRARRILPALFVVMLCTSLLAPLFMLPNDLKTYGQSVVATVFSANNILLYLTSGYWSLAAEFKPLYHTWSLGVEEQFYLVAPLALALVFRVWRSTRAVTVFILVVAVASFLYSLNHDNREFNFLIIFTRAWELLAGSLAALIAMKRGVRNNATLSVIGLALIVGSYVAPYAVSRAQALVNLPAVLGTFLLILSCASTSNPVHRVLTLRPLVFTGLLSYSIYLWHQPILAFVRLSSEYEPGHWQLVGAGLLSIPLAYLSWKFIERPLRNHATTPALRFYIPTSALAVGLVAAGFFLHTSYGLEKYRQEFSYGGDPRSYVDRVFDLQKDAFTENDRTRITVIGNSFARDLVNTILEYEGYSASQYDLAYQFKSCDAALEQNRALVESSDFVLLTSDWGQAGEQPSDALALADCIEEMAGVTRAQVYVVGSKNFGWNNNYVLRYPYEEAAALRTRPMSPVSAFNQAAAEAIGARFINLLALLQDDQGEVPIFTPDGQLMTYDTNHFTPAGARFAGKLLFEQTALASLFNAEAARPQ